MPAEEASAGPVKRTVTAVFSATGPVFDSTADGAALATVTVAL